MLDSRKLGKCIPRRPPLHKGATRDQSMLNEIVRHCLSTARGSAAVIPSDVASRRDLKMPLPPPVEGGTATRGAKCPHDYKPRSATSTSPGVKAAWAVRTWVRSWVHKGATTSM